MEVSLQGPDQTALSIIMMTIYDDYNHYDDHHNNYDDNYISYDDGDNDMEKDYTSSRPIGFKKLQNGSVLDLGQVFQLVKDIF